MRTWLWSSGIYKDSVPLRTGKSEEEDMTLLGLRDQLGTHVEVSAKSGETNSKVGTEQRSGLAIRDQGVVG